MTKALTVHAPTLPGLLPNEEVLRLAESFQPELDFTVFVLNRMPTMVERQTMQRRSDDLGGVLMPIEDRKSLQDEAAEAIAGMLLGYGIARADKNIAETLTTYIEHLNMIPLFAIKAACDDVKASRVFDIEPRTGNRIPISKDYPPSTIRLRSVAQSHVDKVAAEKWKIDKVLAAKRAHSKPPVGADRERMAKKFADLKVTLQRIQSENELAEDELRQRRGEKTNAERQAETTAGRLAHNEELIMREYAQIGAEPVVDGSVVVSPTLAQKTGTLRKRQKPAEDDGRQFGDANDD